MEKHIIRKIKSKIMVFFSFVALVLALVPLISILVETIIRGVPSIDFSFLVKRIPPLGEAGGGIGPAIQGTLIIIGISSLISIPIGVISGIYLSEFGNTKIAIAARFLNDVFTNIPSIVVGILGWSLMVLTIGWSAIAGSVALSVMMIPVITRTTEESLKLVPSTIREAALSLGIPRCRTVFSVVLSSAKKGIATGILLSIARIAGETAPLLLTVLGSRFWFKGLTVPITALPLIIFNFSQSPYSTIDWPRAWGASLILIILVIGISVVVRYFTRTKY